MGKAPNAEMNEPSFERIVSDLFAIKSNTVSKDKYDELNLTLMKLKTEYEVLQNTNVTLHSEIEILAEYKTKLEAKEACEEVVDPKNNEELKKVEALHKRQLAENRKLRKENNDLKKKWPSKQKAKMSRHRTTLKIPIPNIIKIPI